ncbi:DUF2183 domain-containing protein [Azospirillum sp. RWY-5-1]|uniref:DUF2183 domain-containing protein n=2 Tax=Azospirillum oleiclasticum TaxID=2735135 RepID=A0ABX2TLK2_9PROT|nr:DUF2183 domain-containing protein [Azospirillum oleiclasticum]NYZ24008.1 DUF2183 domain-containing protein [Azospirillum oleiclasticum]
MRAVAGVLDLVARPVRTAQGRDGIVIQPYRGYGSRREAFVIGRVFRQSTPHPDPRRERIARHLRDIARRIARRSVAGARVTARLYGTEHTVATDRDGYFRLQIPLRDAPPSDRDWHALHIRLEAEPPVSARGAVYIPPDRARFVVISDIDDTIVHTGVANTLRMLWRLFVEDAASRTAFPGVAPLYRALHAGATGDQGNPLLYVSRAPWGLYDVLDKFFHMHGVPVGPIMFLREWGLSWRRPFPRRAEDHKQALIRHMLDLYDDLPFILIGDSGQHDPEVYRQIVEEHPGRVLAVLIRNVSKGGGREREIEELAAAVTRAGSRMLLAADSAAMAEEAERLNVVPPGTLSAVRGELAGDGGGTAPSAGVVSASELRDVLEQGTHPVPPNVLVEGGDATARRRL